jgi:hypothetical protein
MTARVLALLLVCLLAACQSTAPSPAADPSPASSGYASPEAAAALRDELLYTRAVQAYLWALPLINWYAMKEASETRFGAGYHVLPIWKSRLDAKTLVTTPNSDVIYAMGYVDLKGGPLVIEAPPGLQGILDDAFQRPICSETKIGGKVWCGDVGLPGPDKGKGGKYLLLPPDWKGRVPWGYYAYRSRTYGVFVFWRGFFQDPKALDAPVDLMEQTRIYPLNKKAAATAMEFPDASGASIDMLPPRDARAFEMLKRYVDHEFVDPRDMDMRGVLAAIGIAPGKPFIPSTHEREILDRAAGRASEMGRYLAFEGIAARDGGKYYADRQYINGFPKDPGTPTFEAPSYTDVELRSAFFSTAYSTSPGMALSLPDVGAKYPAAFRDANGEHLAGERAYRLHLPPKIPVKLFWSVTVYDASNASGLANGQPFPSLNQMDQPVKNADGSIDVFFGPAPPGDGKNWLATVPGKGYFVILRLYGPTKAFYDQSWKPGDLEPIR